MLQTVHLKGIEKLDDILTKEYKSTELIQESLEDIALKTQALSINVYPNFRFHKLLPPTHGISVTYRATDRFYADVFRCDKYKVIAVAKLKLSHDAYTTEKAKSIEKLMRRCLSAEPTTPPEHDETAQGRWGPSLGTQDTKIGIYSNQETDIGRSLKTNYYLIVHTSLPTEYLDELQQHDEDVDVNNNTFEHAYSDSITTIKSDISLVTFKEHFGPNSANARALEVALENAKRLLYVASVILDLELDIYPEETRITYRCPEDPERLKRFKDPKYLPEALQFYGLGVPIFPFTTLTVESPLYKHSDLPPEHLRGYPLGYFVAAELMKSTADSFKQTYNIKYHDTVCRAVPIAITDYNTFRFTDYDTLVWMVGVTATGPNVISDEGLELGYVCHNPRPLNDTSSRSSDEWKNLADNTFPISFPKITSANRSIATESMYKFFSLNEGGQYVATGKIPDTLRKEELHISLMNTDTARQCFNPIGVPIHFTPVKVFIPNNTGDIWTQTII